MTHNKYGKKNFSFSKKKKKEVRVKVHVPNVFPFLEPTHKKDNIRTNFSSFLLVAVFFQTAWFIGHHDYN